MAAVPCINCDELMSEKAVVCPHCGARQRDRDPVEPPKRAPYRDPEGPEAGPAPAKPKPQMKLSTDEAAALFATSGASAPPPTGLMALVLPRHDASPPTQRVEWLLTVVSLPMLAVGFVLHAMSPRRWRRERRGTEASLTLSSLLFGGGVLYALLLRFRWSELAVAAAIGLCAGAVLTRMVVRLRV